MCAFFFSFFVEVESCHWLTFNDAITKITNHRAKCLVICAMAARGYPRAPAIFILMGGGFYTQRLDEVSKNGSAWLQGVNEQKERAFCAA